MRKFFKLSNEDVAIIVLACVSFSIGIWANYRGLWLQDLGFSVSSVSKILSVALICSSIISFIVSVISTKVNIKNVLLLAIVYRMLAMIVLLNVSNPYIIKTCILLTIMCETIFSIAIYPLISTINKSNQAYKKHVLVSYIAKDAAVILCGLLLGVAIGNYIVDLNGCLFLALVTSSIGAIMLLLFDSEKETKKKKSLPFKKAVKNIFSSRLNNNYLLALFVQNIPYGMVFGMIMLILTTYIKIDVSVASIFIIVCNTLGSVIATYFATKHDKMSIKTAINIKYTLRMIAYGLAFLTNNIYVIMFSILYAFILARSFDDKLSGTFINNVDTTSQFLFGNIRYFVTNLGEGVGIFLSGHLLQISFNYLFLGAFIFTTLQVIMYLNLNKLFKAGIK